MESKLISVFNSLTAKDNNGLLKKPGDKIEARVTKSSRKVLKINTEDVKYSATEYPNGTRVETKTTRRSK